MEQSQATKDEVQAILVNVAKARDQITYRELSRKIMSVHFEPDSSDLHDLIGELSDEGMQETKDAGMLSAVVVRQEDRMPGKGFFSLAEKIYQIKIPDNDVFYAKELAKVHDWWSKADRIPAARAVSPIPSLSYARLQSYFSLFCEYIQEQDGQPFRSFSYGILQREEGYKSRLYDEARAMLDFESWKESEVGSGAILERAIAAIEQKNNNIVKYQARYGEESREHHSMLEARKNPSKQRDWEQVLYKLYRNDDVASDQQAFDQMVALAGKRYALISYLFFLKNERKYVPNSPTNFDRAFDVLGVPEFSTSHQCSWDNYRVFLALIFQVNEFLRGEMEELGEEVKLLDAHSFLWVVSRDIIRRVAAPHPVVLVPQELHLQPMDPPAPRKSSRNGPVLFDETSMLREQKENAKTGHRAEQLVKDAEIAALEKAGKIELSKKVQIVSEDMSLGYDVLSFTPDGKEKYIEVKGTKVQNGGVFFLTANELARSKEVPNYFLYVVTGVGTDHTRIHYLSGPDFQSNHFHLEPTGYRVRYTIS